MNWTGEPKLAEALRDPVVQALMAADGVDAQALGAVMSGAERKFKLGQRIPAKPLRGADCRRPSRPI